MKKLENPKTIVVGDDNLQLGCLKSCFDYLGVDVSLPWLAGTTAHAFVISITRDVCLSTPWNALAESCLSGRMADLVKNAGGEMEYYQADSDDPHLTAKRISAFQQCRSAVDEGVPCYGYHNFHYQMFAGYDDKGFHTVKGQGPIPFEGSDGFEVCIVRRGNASDHQQALKDALNFSLDYAEFAGRGQNAHGTGDYNAHGLAAYDRWIEAMETGKPGGTWRAGPAWYGCRALAVDFMDEAKRRIGDGLSALLDEAKHHYQVVAENLKPVAEAFASDTQTLPMPPATDAEGTPAVAAEKLRRAREAESKALAVLETFVESL